MPRINRNKKSNLRPMLIQLFNDSRPVTREYLYLMVEEDTISIAETEGMIWEDPTEHKYYITQRGREYRDSNE